MKIHKDLNISTKKNHGFTLIEIIIALTIFAIIATITASVLYQNTKIKERLEISANQFSQMQLAFSMLDKDIKQIVERQIRGNEMHLFPAFIGNPQYIEFTRGGIYNPMNLENRSTLKRIAYLCKRKQLIRRTWPILDTPNRQEYQDKILLTNVKKCTFKYIGMHNNIVPEWHQYTIRRQNQSITSPLPIAIQLSLNIEALGAITMAYPIKSN